eukprot:tig00000388_g24789.t1
MEDERPSSGAPDFAETERELYASLQSASELEHSCYNLVGKHAQQDHGLVRLLGLNSAITAFILVLYLLLRRFAPSFYCRRQRLPLKTWIASVWTAGFDEVVQFCGKEAAFYLAFQRMLLCLTTSMLVVALPSTLPINLSGGRCDGFVATTSSNLPLGPSVKLWAHAGTAIAQSILAWFTIYHFSRWFDETRGVFNPAAAAGQFGDVARRSVMMRHVGRSVTEDEIRETLDQAYPGFVLNVKRTYHLRHLTDLLAEREELVKALGRATAVGRAQQGSMVALESTGEAPPERLLSSTAPAPVRADTVFIHSPQELWSKLVDEVSEAERACAPYLFGSQRARVEQLQRKLNECDREISEAQRANTDYPTRTVFCTFRSSRVARECERDAHAVTGWRLALARCVTCCRPRGPTEAAQTLMSAPWWRMGIDVQPAPDPADIKWQNLRVTTLEFRVRTAAVFLVILIIVFFWNVPLAFVAEVNNLAQAPIIGNLLDALPWLKRSLTQYWPSLLLLIFNTALPSIVYGLVQLQGYITYSMEYRAACTTIFAFFFLNLIIFPSALKSLLKFAEFVTEQMMAQEVLDLSLGLTLSRVLGTVLGSSGSFFVAYVLQACFIRNCVDLLGIPQVLVTAWRTSRAKTPVERAEARDVPPFEFHVGYAEVAILFAVAIMFSSTVPLILPPAAAFFFYRYLVDKANLMYVCRPYTATDGELVPGALDFIYAAIVLWQLAVTGYLTAREKKFAGLALLPLCTLALRFSRALRARNWPGARILRRLLQCYPLQPTPRPAGGGGRDAEAARQDPEGDTVAMLPNDSLAARTEGAVTAAALGGASLGASMRPNPKRTRRPMLASIPRTASMAVSVPTLDSVAYQHPALSVAQIAAAAAAASSRGSFGWPSGGVEQNLVPAARVSSPLQRAESIKRSRGLSTALQQLSPHGPEFPPVECPQEPSPEEPPTVAGELGATVGELGELAASTVGEIAASTAQSVRRIAEAVVALPGLFSRPGGDVSAPPEPHLMASLGRRSSLPMALTKDVAEERGLESALAWADSSQRDALSPASPSPSKPCLPAAASTQGPDPAGADLALRVEVLEAGATASS